MQFSNFSPQVTTLIPLYYIGWADTVLSPTEIAFLQEKINSFTWLSEEDKALLTSWSNPRNPPSPKLVQSWLKAMQEGVETMEDKKSLVNLGLAMLKKQEIDSPWLTEEVVDALHQIESKMGMHAILEQNQIFAEAQLLKERLAQSTIDVEGLQAILDDEYSEIRQRVFTLLRDPVFGLQAIRNKEEYREQVLQWCKLIADQGFGALHFPKEYGGRDSMGAFAAVFETLGYHDLSLTVKFGVQFGLWGGAVFWLGTEKHHQRFLKDVGSLELPGCFAMTETGHGSNVRNCETTATYDPHTDELIIHSPTDSSRKDYIGNAAAHGQMAAVFAQLIVEGMNHGVHAIVVPLRDKQGNVLEGVEIEDCAYKLGLNGVDNGRIRFTQIRVPRFNLLDRYGSIDKHGMYSSSIDNASKRFFTMLGTLVGGRICVPRAGLSAAKSALTIAVRYALKRRQFGAENRQEQLIMDYPSHQRRLMPRVAKAYALDFALTYLTKRFMDRSEEDMREIETLAAGLKAEATRFTSDTIQECREACGGKGYLAENRFADLKADSDIFTTFEGDNTVLMQLVAKGVLSEFKKEVSGSGFTGMLSFVANRLLDTMREKNFVNKNNYDEGHLRDESFWRAAFAYRVQDLSVSVGQRLRKLTGRGLSGHEAFLRCQTHLLEVAQAYVEQVILEQFIAEVHRCSDVGLKEVLTNLCALYALHTIEENKGWYLEQGCMSGVKTKAIRRQVDKLCKRLRMDASSLVDAFGIPDDCLSAPIARYS